MCLRPQPNSCYEGPSRTRRDVSNSHQTLIISLVSDSLLKTSVFSVLVCRLVLRESGLARYLHSAVLLSGTMLVFGGNTHNDTSLSNGAKCFSADFLAYDIGKDESQRTHQQAHLFYLVGVNSNKSFCDTFRVLEFKPLEG